VNTKSQLNLNYGSSPELEAYLSTKNPGDTCETKIVWQLTENDTANKVATGPITEIEIPEESNSDTDEDALTITITSGTPSNLAPTR
jgi:hypothetical protein